MVNITEGIGVLVLYFLIATLIERVVEMALGAWEPGEKKKQVGTFLLGSILGIAISCLAKLDIFAAIGITKENAGMSLYVYYVLTGFALGSGSQFLHQWISTSNMTKQQIESRLPKKDG